LSRTEIGLNSSRTYELRKRLREKNISVLVVQNGMIRRATEGTAVAPAFEGLSGTNAVVWGAEDFVSLVKEIVELDKDEQYKEFEARGGVMDGEPLSAQRVKEISSWPSRGEQLSILSGQLTAPWRLLQSQLTAPGGKLASQIKKKGGDEEA
jgi:large subunit ribosomal protein L10